MYRPIFRRALLAAVALLALATFAAAHEYKLGSLTIIHPWARPTDPMAQTGAAYFKLENAGGAPDTLVGVSSDVAKTVDLHRMVNKDGMMSMQHVDALSVPSKGKAELKPGGYHVMMVGLKSQLKEGDKFPLELTFEKAGKITVEVWVQKPKDDAGGREHKHDDVKQGGMKDMKDMKH